MAEPLVRATSLSRRFRALDGSETLALRSATFQIPAMARIAVMGPSGSGKTTLLHLAAGLDRPTGGKIEWPALGDPYELRPSKIAIAFQGPSLVPSLDVLENVELPLLLGSAARHEATAAARDILERMELADLTRSLPEELSGGQAQRVGLARALAVKPALVLADEPTGQQDRAHADALLEFLLATCSELGVAVLVSTHDPAVAACLDERWEIRDGVVTTGD